MELNEVVQRIVVGHWRTLLLCLLVAINVVVARSLLDSTPAYSSTARIQASSTPPGSDTEADSVLNRVKGLASSGRVLTQTMQEAGVTNRDVTVLGATGLRVSRLGTSAIVDISVVDRDPGVARKLTDSLAKRVVELLDSSGTERVTSLRTDLQNRRDKVLVDREKKAIELGRMVGAADRVDLQAQVGTLDREIDSLDALLRQLAVSSATSSSATVISEATPPEPVPRHVPTDVALVLLLGLVAGLSLCILIEVFRPRVPGGRSFARELGVPLLGAVQSGSKDQQPTPQVPAATDESLREIPLEPRAQPETASEYSAAVSPAALLAIWVSADRAAIRRIVVAGNCGGDQLTALAERLSIQLGWAQSYGTLSRGDMPSASWNGHGANTSGEVDGGLGRPVLNTGVLAPSQRVPTLARRSRRLEVVSLRDLNSRGDTSGAALLYIACPRRSYAHLEDFRNLAAATGWPVLGVLNHSKPQRERRRT